MATNQISTEKPKPRTVYITFASKGESSKTLTVYGAGVETVMKIVTDLFGKSIKSK